MYEIAMKYAHKRGALHQSIIVSVKAGNRHIERKSFKAPAGSPINTLYAEACSFYEGKVTQYRINDAKPPMITDLVQMQSAAMNVVGREKRTYVKKIKTTPLMLQFIDAETSDIDIQDAITMHGFDVCVEKFNRVIERFSQVHNALKSKQAVERAANIKIADAILAARNCGVAMPSPSKEIEALISELMAARTA